MFLVHEPIAAWLHAWVFDDLTATVKAAASSCKPQLNGEDGK